MQNKVFITRFAVLLAIQLVLAKYCQIGQFVYISILPAMILCMPTSRPSWWVTVAAFLSGLLVDGLADGVPGLNAAAILPVAVSQKAIIRMLIDQEAVKREYDLSFRENGYLRVSLGISACTLLFMIIYVTADCIHSESFILILLKILCSSIVSFIFGMAVFSVLTTSGKSDSHGGRKR